MPQPRPLQPCEGVGGVEGCATKVEVEDSDTLELNTKGIYTEIGDSEVS
jgi:hypothetical protein